MTSSMNPMHPDLLVTVTLSNLKVAIQSDTHGLHSGRGRRERGEEKLSNMDDGGYTSTTTITSVTEDTEDDFSDLTETVDETSGITISDTNNDASDTLFSAPLPPPSVHLRSGKKKHNGGIADVKMDSDNNNDENSPIKNHHYAKPFSRTANLAEVDFSSRNWFQHKNFNQYWRHYHFVTLWCQKHMEVYHTLRQEFHPFANNTRTPPLLQAFSHVPTHHHQTFKKPVSHRTHRNRKARQRRKAAKKKKVSSAGSSDIMDMCISESEGKATAMSLHDSTEEVNMEITEEMLDFFAQTHKHRLERDSQKKQNKEGKESKHINIEEVHCDQKERTVAAPKERPGSRRTFEMRFLYGKGAAMIHGMETALQMNFDRNLDIRQPKLWPNMPFKIIFD